MRDKVQIAIIGGGLAGATLANVMLGQGRDVVLCDLHATYPPDFRAEKLSPSQVGLLRRLGLWDRVRAVATPIEDLAIARFGRIVEHRESREYGIDYADLVNAVRDPIPRDRIRHGRVAKVEASPDVQRILFSDGHVIEARLAVLATGLGQSLLAPLGIDRKIVEANHCLAIGFDVAVDQPSHTRALTYHGERPADRSAYLSLFPIGDRLRANLFVYRRRHEEWSHAFRRDPRGTLLDMMPGLAALIGDFAVLGTPVLRPIDLHACYGHVRDGVVLIGDAFATACPAGGSGCDKVLTDVERLAALAPGWLATGDTARDKIAGFYADPTKMACDEQARRQIGYAKAMAVDPGLGWTLRRYRNFYAQKARNWLRQQVRRGNRSRVA